MKMAMWLVTCAVCCVAGFLFGVQKDKRWQDSYYAAHPVVKEVRGLCADKESSGESICYRTDGSTFHLDWDGVLRIGGGAPPKKAKPAKAKRHELTCKDIGGCAVVVPGQDLRINCAPNFDCNKRGDIDPQGAVCVAGSSDGHPIEAPCPQITWPTRKP